MNSLTLLLYFIGVISAIAVVIHILNSFSFLVLMVSTIGFLINKSESDKEWGDFFRRVIKWDIVVLMVSSLISILLPSERTMTMMAASEIGERVIHSQKTEEAFNKVIDPSVVLLNKYIESEINRLDGTKSK